VNAEGAGNVAAAAAAAGALAIQISTDYSFDGTAGEPYTESSPTNAIGAYGRTKLAGESAVAELATPEFAIVRSSWLFGPHGKNFVDTILRAGAERDELKVVHDQVGCPTYTGHLASALVDVAERRLTGVLHIAGAGHCSWYELAVAALEAAGVECTVHPTTAAEYGRAAPRPAYSVLVTERDDAPRLPAWQDGLAAHLSASRALT
jgi:dTDP-4-dehydrorhamnose reductase